MKQVVIMPGGFHPFHAGHYALYQQAQKAFPSAEVFVAATNDTSTRPFPFAVKEKLAKLAGVEAGHFVQVKSPFQAREITASLDPENTQLIFVRSEKDADKPPQAGGVKKDGNPAYLQPLEGQSELAPMNRHAYMAYLPTVEFGPGMTSATEIRTAWPRLNEKRKTALVMSLYPKTQASPALAANVVKMLDTAISSEELNEFAPSDDSRDDRPKFLPWNEFIGDLEAMLGDHFSVVQNIVKSTIKARFVPHDPMEFGPTMLYSYYETRAGRNKGAISTRGAIQVGKYTEGGITGQIKGKLLTTFSLLKGHPFERHFDLTGENVQKIADIIIGNTQGALQFKPENVAEDLETKTKVGRRNDTNDWAWYYMGSNGKWKWGGAAKSKHEAQSKAQEYSSKQGVAEGGFSDESRPIQNETGVEAYGYVYDRRDQRVMWRKEFSSAEAAYKWADSKNATVLGTRPVEQTVDEDYIDEKK
jgi:hypothetical protein